MQRHFSWFKNYNLNSSAKFFSVPRIKFEKKILVTTQGLHVNLSMLGVKAIVNLFSYEKRILILFENNHYITPYKKNGFFLNM